MVIGLTIAATGLFFDHIIIAIVGIFLYVFSYNLGIGPINWLLASEIFPLHMRAVGKVSFFLREPVFRIRLRARFGTNFTNILCTRRASSQNVSYAINILVESVDFLILI